jgi:hypothetical protein
MVDFFYVSENDRGNLCLKPPPTQEGELAEETRPGDRRNLRGVSLYAGVLILQKRLAELEAICLTAQVPSAKVNGSRSQPASLKRRTRADRVPFGWRLDPRDGKRLVPDRDEQTTIRRAQILAAAGHSLRESCRQLDKEGRGRRGKKWEGSHSVLAGILRRSKSI